MPKTPRTPAQIEASRRNGALSKGPLSQTGKARAALNSVTHGLTAGMTLLPGEDLNRFQTLLEDLIADLAPQTTLEFACVEEIAHYLWKQRRAWSFEASAFAKIMENGKVNQPIDAWASVHKSKDVNFAPLLQHQSRISFQLDRAYRRFQDLRRTRETAPDAAPEPGQVIETMAQDNAHPSV